MPTTTFPANTAGISYSGTWDDAYAGGAQCRLAYAGNAEVDFTATGTDLSMSWATTVTSGLTVQVTVDGGTATTLTLPGTANTYTTVGLFSGLAEGAHTVKIAHVSGTPSAWYLNYANAFGLTGAAPAISPAPNFGPIYEVSAVAGLGSVEGGWNWAGPIGGINNYYKYPAAVVSGFPDALVRFRSNATALYAWMFCNGVRVKFWMDGAPSGPLITLPNTGAMGWVTLATGLDGTAHEYGLAVTTATTTYLSQFRAAGGTIQQGSYPTRGGLAALGDSITAGYVGTSNDSSLSWLSLVGQQRNRAVYNAGASGATLLSVAGGVDTGNNAGAGLRHTDYLQYLIQQRPDYVVTLIGINDINVASPPPTATFQLAYQNMLGRIRSGCPASKILCLGILPTSQATGAANRSTYNAAISAALTAFGDPNAQYISTDGWINTTSDLADGLHPSAAGCAKIATQLASYVTTWAPSSSASRPIVVGG